MRGFIGIDAGVFDQNKFKCLRKAFYLRCQRMRRQVSIKAAIDISRPGDFKSRKSRYAANGGYQFLCDFAWRFAQRACQLEGDRKGIVAHLYLGRLFYREARNFYLELFQQDGAKTLKQNLSISAIHKSRPWALGRRGDLVAIR